MSKSKKLLTELVGSDGFETLQKAIFRRGTDHVADPLELYLPLLVVPRAVLSWLVRNIHPLKVGEHRDFKFPGRDDITMHVEKQNTDTYRGEWIKGGRILHSFEKQTLPSVAGAMMTVGELYDHLVEPEAAGKPEAVDGPKEEAGEGECDMAQAIMDESGIYEDLPEDPEKIKWLASQNNVAALTGVIGKLVDALVDKKVSRESFEEELDDMDKKEIKGDEQKVVENKVPELKGAKPQEKDPVVPDCKEVKVAVGEIKKEAMPETKAEAPGGAAMPKQPTQPVQSTKPTMPSRKLKNLAGKQAQQSASGRAPSAPKPPAMAPKGPTQPMQPKAPAMKAEVGGRTLRTGYLKILGAEPLVKPPVSEAQRRAMGAAASGDSTLGIPKSVGKEFIEADKGGKLPETKKSETVVVTPEQISKKCPHCGVPEFKKSEDGTPVFSPCACFRVEEQSKIPFVEVKKSENGTYELEFSPKADPESIKAFLLTLKAKLMISKALSKRGS